MGGAGRIRLLRMRMPATLDGKARAAFRSGFLGIDSLGWSTLVQIVEASEEDRAAAVDLLAQRLVDASARPISRRRAPAAEEEIAFAASLSDHPQGHAGGGARKYEDGTIREAFRTLTPSIGPKPMRAFAFLEVEGEDEHRPDAGRLVAHRQGTARE